MNTTKPLVVVVVIQYQWTQRRVKLSIDSQLFMIQILKNLRNQVLQKLDSFPKKIPTWRSQESYQRILSKRIATKLITID